MTDYVARLINRKTGRSLYVTVSGASKSAAKAKIMQNINVNMHTFAGILLQTQYCEKMWNAPSSAYRTVGNSDYRYTDWKKLSKFKKDQLKKEMLKDLPYNTSN